MAAIDGDTKSGFEGERICGNCQHYETGRRHENGKPKRRKGVCHNGISLKYHTAVGQGCGHGFYPCIIRWPLGAGPGGKFKAANVN